MTTEQKSTDKALTQIDQAIEERQASLPALIDDAPHSALMRKDTRAFATNFQGDKLELFRFISRVKNGEHGKLLDAVGQELALEVWYAHEVEFVNEDGEVVEAKRVVLVDTKGDSYECVSQGVFDFLSDAVAVYGYKPWHPPLRVKVTMKQTRRWRMLTLLPLPAKAKK